MTDKDSAATLESVLNNRKDAYQLLSKLFLHEVDRAQLEKLHALKLPADTGNANLDEGYRQLSRALGAMSDRTEMDLSVDYLRTFIGNTTEIKHAAFPYESVYTSEEHLLMQEARDEVLAAYRAEKVIIDDKANEPEDHVGYELAFMSLLSKRTADALSQDNTKHARELLEKSADFLDAHLLVWIDEFTQMIETVSKTDFYKALGKILAGFLEEDRALITEMTDEIKKLES